MNLELKEFRDIVENGISKDRDNEVPSLEPASEAIRNKMNKEISNNLQNLELRGLLTSFYSDVITSPDQMSKPQL